MVLSIHDKKTRTHSGKTQAGVVGGHATTDPNQDPDLAAHE